MYFNINIATDFRSFLNTVSYMKRKYKTVGDYDSH